MADTAEMTYARPASGDAAGVQPDGVPDTVRFAALVEEHQHKLCNFIHRYTRNRQDAEDLTQDTFVKAFKHFHRYDPRHTFSAWLYTIARRTVYNHHRDHRPTDELTFEVAAAGPSPGDVADRSDRAAALWEEVRRLKSPYQEVLILKYVDGLSIDEIARVLDRSQTGVKILLFRARGMLRNRPTFSRS